MVHVLLIKFNIKFESYWLYLTLKLLKFNIKNIQFWFFVLKKRNLNGIICFGLKIKLVFVDIFDNFIIYKISYALTI